MIQEPNIYSFHDYIAFLKEWMNYLSRCERPLSLRNIARRSGLSPSAISLALSRKRRLKERSFEKFLMVLRLKPAQRNYLQHLYKISEADNAAERIESLRKIQNIQQYRKTNFKEVQVFNYLSNWLNVVIREMANLKDFDRDPTSIKKQLNFLTDLKKIKKSDNFLFNEKLLEEKDGKIVQGDSQIICDANVFKLSLLDFHRQMLSLATEALGKQSPDERFVEGYTFAIKRDDIAKLNQILSEALEKIESLEAKSSEGDHVYHAFVGSFQVSKSASLKQKKKEKKAA